MMEYIEPIYYYPQYRQQEYHRDNARPSGSYARATVPHPPSSRPPHATNFHCRQEEPWDHMAQTYAWVLEQEVAEMARKNEETVQWVHKQQERDRHRDRGASRVFVNAANARRCLVGQGYSIEYEPTGRMLFRGDYLECWDAERLMQEEMRRSQASRLEMERCRRAYERRKQQEETRMERERAKARRDEAERQAWRAYEERWTTLDSASDSSEPLRFHDIPWPMICQPQTMADITPGRIVMFLLSPLHADGLSRKDKIRSALRRWHPDRLVKLFARVAESDKAKIEDGVGVVVRCLNNLLERES